MKATKKCGTNYVENCVRYFCKVQGNSKGLRRLKGWLFYQNVLLKEATGSEIREFSFSLTTGMA